MVVVLSGGEGLYYVTQTYCVGLVVLLPLLALHSHQGSVMCVSLDLCDSFFWEMKLCFNLEGVNFMLILARCGRPKASLTCEARRASVAAGAQNLQAAFLYSGHKTAFYSLHDPGWSPAEVPSLLHFIVQTALS